MNPLDSLKPEKRLEMLRYCRDELKKGLAHVAQSRDYIKKRDAYEMLRDLHDYYMDEMRRAEIKKRREEHDEGTD